ncbi:MAG: hypothetical protein FJ344_02490 [Sphingomonadales bacterium]|nr:hypothetical protein [Sphingomonadales bacterium]
MQTYFALAIALLLLTLAVSFIIFFMFRHLQRQRVMLPLEIQAYERLLLFVERLRPEGLLMRTPTAGDSKEQIRHALLAGINIEWEHNLSQQLYVDPTVWLAASAARDEVIRLIHSATADPSASDSGTLFRQRLLHLASESGLTACNRALRILHQKRP